VGLGELFGQTAQFLVIAKADTSDLRSKLKDIEKQQKSVADSFKKATEEQQKQLFGIALGLQKMHAAATAEMKQLDERNDKYDSWGKKLQATNVSMQIGAKLIAGAGAAWKSYERSALAAGGADASRAKAFRSALNTWDEGLESRKVALGGMVAALAPLVELAGRVTGYVADMIAGNDVISHQGKKFNVSSYGMVSQDAVRAAGLNQAEQVGLFDLSSNPGLEKAVRESKALAGVLGEQTLAGWADAWGAGVYRQAKDLDLEAMKKNGETAANSLADAFSGGMIGVAKRYNESGASVRDWMNRRDRASGPGGGYDATQRGQAEIEGFNASDYLDPSYTAYQDQQRAAEARAQQLRPGAMGAGIGQSGGEQGFLGGDDFGASQYASALAAMKGHREEFMGDRREERKESLLAMAFGKPEEFEMYAGLIQGLTGTWEENMLLLGEVGGVAGDALKSGFAEWVSGAKSASEAAKGVFKSTIQGIATVLFAHAIEHGALAVGAAASLNWPQAGAHALSAAKFGAAAVAVGGLARLLGGSGASGGGGGGSSSAGGYGGIPNFASIAPRGGSGEQVTNMYIGDMWSDDNPRAKRNSVARAVRSARRELEDTRGVEFR
jgi:hypothetical protein